MYSIINSFESIEIKPNTLVICDIDETIIHFEKNVYYFYNKLKEDFYEDFSTKELIDITTIMYETHKLHNKPIHTDLKGFNQLLKKLEDNSGNLIFLTARNIKSDYITKNDLLNICINSYQYPIHYTNNNISKGEYISYFIDLDGVDEIIFIDDMDENLESFNYFFPKSKYYKFIYEKKTKNPKTQIDRTSS
jgi:hypothetical protein